MTYVVQDMATLPNAEAYIFRALSIFFLFWYNWEKLGRPFEIEPEFQNHVPSLEGSFPPEFAEFLKFQASYQNFHSGMLFDSSRVIEGKYLDLFARLEIHGKTKHWAIGPFNPVEIPNSSANNRHKCLEWLDKQETNSVIYVSFGTTTSFSEEEIKELAIGLEESEQKFLWVLRDADRGDGFGGEVRRVHLPKGYEERIEGKGIIVRDWAPQIEILEHPSTGGFMSHCGWNSSMESITAGVPMVTWPMHSDQPGNAVLITKVLKIGLAVKDWDRRNELISSSTIEKVVRRLMNSEEGAEMRDRAMELSEAVKRSVDEGGVTRMELDSFIAHISRE